MSSCQNQKKVTELRQAMKEKLREIYSSADCTYMDEYELHPELLETDPLGFCLSIYREPRETVITVSSQLRKLATDYNYTFQADRITSCINASEPKSIIESSTCNEPETYVVTLTAPRYSDSDVLDKLIALHKLKQPQKPIDLMERLNLMEVSATVSKMMRALVIQDKLRKDNLLKFLDHYQKNENKWSAQGCRWNTLKHQRAYEEIHYWMEIIDEHGDATV
jgi:hypothetical protein